MQTAVKSQSSTRRRSSRRRLTSRHHRPLFCRYVETSDALNGVTKFWFDANGQAAVLQDVKGNQIRATYNAIGQRVSVNDPNQGVSSFTYNALGEVLSQTDARGIVSNFTYDKLGRKTKLTATSDANGDGTNDAIIDTWVYDPIGAKGQLSVSKRTINGATERQDTSAFDSIYIRPITQTTVQNTGGATTRTYVTDVQYDGYYGRVKAMFMPNGEGEQFIYNPHGYETEQRNATSAAVYRQVVSTNARGQTTRELKGFNLATDTVYWDDGQVKQITHTKNGVAIRQLNYAYDVFGNVATQALNNGLAGNTVENFAYDKLHRLTQSTRTGAASATVSYGYDAAGNFNFKSDFSTATGTPYNLATGGLGGGGANAVKSVALAAGGTRSYGYDASGNMTSDNAGFSAIYDHANLATKLQKGAVTNYFTYGPSNAKAKQTGSDGTKAYVGGYEDWVTAAQTKVSLGNYAQVTNGTGGRQLHYFLTDRLGSVDAVTDSTGTLIETRGFDAFGAPRTGTWGDAQQIASTAITPKGFTSHEHLNSLKLIHMNGRIYDYQLGRFMGVDPFIQMPTNSQSLNPYSYIMNNPLSGTDPTGYASNCVGKDPDCTKTPEPPKETASEKRWKMACGGYCQGSAKIDGNGVGGRRENGANKQSNMSVAGHIAADILSNLQKEPLGASGGIATKSLMGSSYMFPIDNVSVTTDTDNIERISGNFDIDGTAATSAIEHLRNNFGNVSGKTESGQKWVLSFTFQIVDKDGDVHFQWMTPSQEKALIKDFSRQYGKKMDGKQIIGSTRLGSNTMLFNPLYKTVDSIAAGWNITRSEAIKVYDYTRGSFAHEFSHGAGMAHTPNSSNSMTSYSSTRRVNFNDRARWCYLATENQGCLQ
jgi:RHS repeat-associated protein